LTGGRDVGSGRAWDGPLTSVLAAPSAGSWLVAGEGLTGTAIWVTAGAAGAGLAAGSSRDGASVGAFASRAEAEQRAVTQDSD